MYLRQGLADKMPREVVGSFSVWAILDLHGSRGETGQAPPFFGKKNEDLFDIRCTFGVKRLRFSSLNCCYSGAEQAK